MVNITTPDGYAISNKALILVKMTPVTTGMGTLNRFPIQLDMNMEEPFSSLMIHPILPMAYLIHFYLVAGSDPSKPGTTGLVAAFPIALSKYKLFFPAVVHTYSTLNVF